MSKASRRLFKKLNNNSNTKAKEIAEVLSEKFQFSTEARHKNYKSVVVGYENINLDKITFDRVIRVYFNWLFGTNKFSSDISYFKDCYKYRYDNGCGLKSATCDLLKDTIDGAKDSREKKCKLKNEPPIKHQRMIVNINEMRRNYILQVRLRDNWLVIYYERNTRKDNDKRITDSIEIKAEDHFVTLSHYRRCSVAVPEEGKLESKLLINRPSVIDYLITKKHFHPKTLNKAQLIKQREMKDLIKTFQRNSKPLFLAISDDKTLESKEFFEQIYIAPQALDHSVDKLGEQSTNVYYLCGSGNHRRSHDFSFADQQENAGIIDLISTSQEKYKGNSIWRLIHKFDESLFAENEKARKQIEEERHDLETKNRMRLDDRKKSLDYEKQSLRNRYFEIIATMLSYVKIKPATCLSIIKDVFNDNIRVYSAAEKEAEKVDYILTTDDIKLVLDLCETLPLKLKDQSGSKFISTLNSIFPRHNIALNEKSNTKNKHPRNFADNKTGEDTKMNMHLKLSNGIRIHFTYSRDDEKVVIGHFGEHMPQANDGKKKAA